MVMFQKEFDSYEKMIKYLAAIRHIDKADFELRKGTWILNIVRFDNIDITQ